MILSVPPSVCPEICLECILNHFTVCSRLIYSLYTLLYPPPPPLLPFCFVSLPFPPLFLSCSFSFFVLFSSSSCQAQFSFSSHGRFIFVVYRNVSCLRVYLFSIKTGVNVSNAVFFERITVLVLFACHKRMSLCKQLNLCCASWAVCHFRGSTCRPKIIRGKKKCSLYLRTTAVDRAVGVCSFC